MTAIQHHLRKGIEIVSGGGQSGAAILKLGFRHVERHAFHIKRSEDTLAQEFAERRARYLHVQHLPQARRRKTEPSVGARLQKAYEKVMAGTRTR